MIIGSGQSGGPLSTALVAAGRRTVLIERDQIGGTCINVGCTPTKTMVASADTADTVRRAGSYGVRTDGPHVDMMSVRERKRRIVEEFRSGSRAAIERGGVEILMGEASFTSEGTVHVRLRAGGERELQAPLTVIDTGTRPASPPIDGLEIVPALDSTTIMELDEVPEHLLVLGGGYVGVEFGQMFRRFGSRVTIVQTGPALLAREDPDIAEAVRDILAEDSIEVLLRARTTRVSGSAGAVTLTLDMDGVRREVQGSHLLLATGRRPQVEALNLEVRGIATDGKGFIRVDERLQTTAPGVYATGDVTGGPAFTHISYDDFRILRANLIEGGDRTTRDRLVPYTVFIDPQLGRVGLSETEARQRGIDVKVARLEMSHVARALETGETRGLLKAVVDAGTGRILGCAALGMEGGEIMAMFEIAMLGKLHYTTLRDGIFAHPTLAESLNNLFSPI